MRAAIAIGANLGDPELAVRAAIDWLRHHPDWRLVRASRLRRTEPWGVVDQPEFVNAVALVDTSWPPREVLNALFEHERFAGRVRRTRWGPRELDLDLLWMDDVILDEPGLTLPHPRIPERPFVLEPLAEIAPEWRHPQTSMSAREMLDALHARGDSTRSAGKHT
jgi:2-amino-4-hydroxy-6-hydroxymethyldihydropteridine diphosphokinase